MPTCQHRGPDKVWTGRDGKKTVPFFPAGFTDELFASRISIYHITRGHQTAEETFQELFDSGKFSLTHSVPQHIGRLAERIPGERTAVTEDLYRRSTLLPLFELFGGRTLIDNSKLSSFHRRIVGNARATYVCPDCLRDDQRDFGTPFLHRSHQLPSSTCCWKHGTQLIDRCPECRCPIEPPIGLILAPWKGCHCGLQYHQLETGASASSEAEQMLAKFGHGLLHCPPDVLGLPYFVEAYRNRAKALGFSWGRNVNRKKLMAAIEATFGKTLLATIDWSYRKGQIASWLHVFDMPSAMEASISRHLILGAFLYEDADILVGDLRKLVNERRTQGEVSLARVKPVKDDKAASIRKFDPATMLDRVVRLAREQKLSVDALWSVEYASMKRLVRHVPGVIEMIEARLKSSSEKTDKRASKPPSRLTPEMDAALAEKVRVAGAAMHADTDKPQRITKNQVLLKAANGKKLAWPTTDTAPLTLAHCESVAESQWHFYARRLLWTMLEFAGRNASKSMLVEASGLEYRKAGDVLDYLLKFDYQPTPESYSQQLERLGILKKWKGPKPDSQYPKVGRLYIRKELRLAAENGRASGDKA